MDREVDFDGTQRRRTSRTQMRAGRLDFAVRLSRRSPGSRFDRRPPHGRSRLRSVESAPALTSLMVHETPPVSNVINGEKSPSTSTTCT